MSLNRLDLSSETRDETIDRAVTAGQYCIAPTSEVLSVAVADKMGSVSESNTCLLTKGPLEKLSQVYIAQLCFSNT